MLLEDVRKNPYAGEDVYENLLEIYRLINPLPDGPRYRYERKDDIDKDKAGSDLETDEASCTLKNPRTREDILAAFPWKMIPIEYPAPKIPTREELRSWRITRMDGVRTIALTMLILQSAVTQAVSMPFLSTYIEQYPCLSVLIIMFSAYSRNLAVPLLVFVAGFASHISMAVHETSPAEFALRRTWKTAAQVLLYRVIVYVTKQTYPQSSPEDNRGYYASRQGIDTLLNGPTFYLLGILFLDFVYATLRSVAHTRSGARRFAHYVTSKARYDMTRLFLFLFVSLWSYIVGAGYLKLRIPAGSFQERFLYATGATEPHFPFLHIVAYIAGVQFLHCAKYLQLPPSSSFTPGIRLFWGLGYSTLVLVWLIRTSPSAVLFLNLRARPALALRDAGTARVYTSWIMTMLSTAEVPQALVRFVFTHPLFGTDNGRLYHTYFMVHIPALFWFTYYLENQNMHPILGWMVFGCSALTSVILTAFSVSTLGQVARRLCRYFIKCIE
ncbi:hypothetical protein BDN70DRAFT_937683 [Pholiota conissans]|uniref:Uncharacterized protein n=1 Tax=Pholiota conissans TaxID=109636 RepID=A0A9P6CN56_9AGAR|nr:hypothetical protein BDN70DRAFT_937683 [Pholiota conissans]